MLIAGAGGHAKEILDVLHRNAYAGEIALLDETLAEPQMLFDRYKVYNSLAQASEFFQVDDSFCLGVGTPLLRDQFRERLSQAGGRLVSVISSTSTISSLNVKLENGLNIMHNVLITSNATIGEGTLLNAASIIHHDVSIGRYCEISPRVILLGAVQVGDFTRIGSNATILPKTKVGNNVVIGAGAVVTRDIPDNSLVVGVPGIIKRKD